MASENAGAFSLRPGAAISASLRREDTVEVSVSAGFLFNCGSVATEHKALGQTFGYFLQMLILLM